jgi:hypothetical protein
VASAASAYLRPFANEALPGRRRRHGPNGVSSASVSRSSGRSRSSRSSRSSSRSSSQQQQPTTRSSSKAAAAGRFGTVNEARPRLRRAGTMGAPRQSRHLAGAAAAGT